MGFINTNTAITRQLMRTARTLEAKWRQVLRGSVSAGAKEDESRTGRVWDAGCCNTGKECNFLFQFLLNVFPSIEERFFLQVHSDFPNAPYRHVQCQWILFLSEGSAGENWKRYKKIMLFFLQAKSLSLLPCFSLSSTILYPALVLLSVSRGSMPVSVTHSFLPIGS
jgi:hypothetical protein